MELCLTPAGNLTVDASILCLRNARPVLNGTILKDWHPEIAQHDEAGIVLHYTAARGQGKFGLRANYVASGRRLGLRYWLEGLGDDVELNSFGLHFEAVENVRAYLRNGYLSWDGSFYVEPEALNDFEDYESRPETGYGMTQLLPRLGSGSVVAGFDRHDRFQHTFTFDTRHHPPSLMVQTWWDQKERTGLPRCESEKLVIFEHPAVEEALRDWARLVAAASPIPPRLKGPSITGWCSWYNLYSYITAENILEYLRSITEVVKREDLPLRIYQIDDGFTPEMGDWLEIKPQFPRGMKPLLDSIRAAGFVPGLWIAPFMVGNRSHLFRDHPNWVVKDRATGEPFVQWRLYGEYRWHKRSEEYYILDTTHPEAFEYLRQVFRVWRHEWGCEYFKTDFMHFGSEHGPDEIVWHAPGKSRIEVWRRVAEMIREEIGDATWLGCGCPLWASVGLVDGIRIGRDVGVAWTGNRSAQSLLRDQATRNFANHILWQIDPDCVLLRDRFHHLTGAELRSLAIYAGMSGGVMMTSDDLGGLSADRLRLWKLILSEKRGTCQFPFLGQTQVTYERMPADQDSRRVRHEPRAIDPVLVQVRPPASENEIAAVFIFNTGEQPVARTYSLVSLGLSSPQHVFDWTADRVWPNAVESVSVVLPAHDSALLFLSPEPINTAPERLA